jgi:hypothetical protein
MERMRPEAGQAEAEQDRGPLIIWGYKEKPMAETVQNYQYIRKNTTVYHDPSLDLTQIPVILLEGQKLIVNSISGVDVDSLAFALTGVELTETGSESGKVNIAAYPNQDVNVLLYTCPANKSFVGMLTMNHTGSNGGYADVAISVSTPGTPQTVNTNDLPSYELVAYMPFGGNQTLTTRSIVMTAGQKLVCVEVGNNEAVSFVMMGRQFDSEGAETLINQGIVNPQLGYGVVLYECPTGCAAIVDVIMTNDASVSYPTAKVFLHGMPLTTDEDGDQEAGGGGGQ